MKNNNSDENKNIEESTSLNEYYNYKLPKRLFIGFEKGLSKKDFEETKTTVFNHVKDNFESRRNSYYKIVKIKNHNWLPDGYMYEIQENGSQFSYIDKILENLNEKSEVIIITKEKNLQIQKIYESVNCYYLTDNTEILDENVIRIGENELLDLKPKDMLIPVYKDSYTLFSFGIIFFAFSLISLFLSMIFKYVIFDKHEEFKNISNYDLFPTNQVKSLNSTTTSKIRSVSYDKENWYVQYEYKMKDNKNEIPEKIKLKYIHENIKKIKDLQEKRIQDDENK